MYRYIIDGIYLYHFKNNCINVLTYTHYHTYDEWWVVLEGEIHWVIEGRDEPVQAKAGDFVYVPAQTFHHIFPKGDGPSVRLGIALPGQGHLHERPTAKARVTIDV